ncbi:putative glutamate receptor 3.6-like [Capsicum annuum]|nr:putative glutamate receptor 3.6-like [Capsicum annuum]
MTLSFINIIFLLLILVTPPYLLLAKKCFLSNKYEVHVINNLTSDSPHLKIHCASKNDDLGYHYPAIYEDFNWSFCQPVFGKTLYFCHFWWNLKEKSFIVFNDYQFCVSDSTIPNPKNNCKWEVRPDGFYLEIRNTTGASSYMYHYLDWS